MIKIASLDGTMYGRRFPSQSPSSSSSRHNRHDSEGRSFFKSHRDVGRWWTPDAHQRSSHDSRKRSRSESLVNQAICAPAKGSRKDCLVADGYSNEIPRNRRLSLGHEDHAVVEPEAKRMLRKRDISKNNPENSNRGIWAKR